MKKRLPPFWFKRKRFGYGWTPSTWQGWIVIAGYVALLLAGTVILHDTPEDTFTIEVVWYILYSIAITLILIAITVVKGPTAKWRWGSRSDDDPAQDS